MKKFTLQFGDLLLLLEFVSYTNLHECAVDTEAGTITCAFSDAELELALNGYGATVVGGSEPDV